MYVLWVSGMDYIYGYRELYLTRIRNGGSRATGWPEEGVLIGSHPYGTFQDYRRGYSLVADGPNGVYLGYRGQQGFIVRRFTPAGVPWPAWPVDGLLVDANAYGFNDGLIDPTGGLYTAQSESMWIGSDAVAVSRVDQFGRLGDPAPVVAYVKDVPNDQGGHVKVAWRASGLDVGPGFEIARYRVWRSVPPQSAVSALRSGAARVGTDVTPPGPTPLEQVRTFRRSFLAGATVYWEHVGEQVALAQSGYSQIVTTLSDSTAGGNPRTLFMVVAHSGAASAWFESAPDSGYSVDNLAPAVLSQVTARYVGGGTELRWQPGPEQDLAGYRIYRGISPGFVPDPSSLLATTIEPHHVDSPHDPAFYKLSAVDRHGNEGPVVTVHSSGLLEVAYDTPGSLAFGQPSPSPATVGADVRFDLPVQARILLEVFDTSGRRVRLLARGSMPAGGHRLHWDLRDDQGRDLRSGLYFLRLMCGDRVLTRRLVVSR
jgi:hypothetical protein